MPARAPRLAAPSERVQPYKVWPPRYVFCLHSNHFQLSVAVGCPTPYAPLSLNAPETLRDLRVRQATNMDAVLWWPCPEASTMVQVMHASNQCDALVSGTACQVCIDSLLQKELSAALEDTLSSPIPIPEGTSGSSTPVKTSKTHPLKFVLAHSLRSARSWLLCYKRSISTIIPPELLPAVSSHLLTNPQPSPIIFYIPDSYTLHRITGYAQLIPPTNPTSIAVARKAHSHLSRRTSLLPPIPVHSSPSAPIPHTPPLQISPNKPKLSIAEALQAAIDTHLNLTSTPHLLDKSRSSPPSVTKPSSSSIIKQSTQVHPLSDESARDPRISPPKQLSPEHRGIPALPKALFPSVASEREQ